jgi:flagellar motor switch protein FliN
MTLEVDATPTPDFKPNGQGSREMSLAAPFARVKVTVQIMLGSTRLTLAEMLSLKPGSSISLDQKLGEAVLVIVNNSVVAKGELYVLEQSGNRLGVKITELIHNSASDQEEKT